MRLWKRDGKAKKPIIGRDGPAGRWYIRIPMWLQSTILIFTIGVVSLVILLVVSATQTWYYSKKLMTNRLSNFATLISLQLEQDFALVRNYAMAAASTSSLVSFAEAANKNNITMSDWTNLEREVSIQFAVYSTVESMKLYDLDINEVFYYRQRIANSASIGQQNLFFPSEFFPLTYSNETRNTVINALSNNHDAVLSNRTVPSVHDQNTLILYFSVTTRVSRTPEYAENTSLDSARSATNQTNDDYSGFATFVLSVNLSLHTGSSSFAFSQYESLVVKQQDIALIKGNVNAGIFAYTLPITSTPFTSDYSRQVIYNITDFPVVLDAYSLAAAQEDIPVIPRIVNTSDANFLNSTRSGSQSTNLYVKLKNHLFGNNEDTQSNKVGIDKFQRKASNSQTNSSSSNSNSGSNSGSDSGSSSGSFSLGRPNSAEMRTRSPNLKKASIGYSYASVFDQTWLIFVQIPQSEAFASASKLRSVVIGVGVGILGAVVIIILPLSRWQTRGLYVIYQNLKLQPMYFVEDDQNSEEDSSMETTLARSVNEKRSINENPFEPGEHLETDVTEDTSQDNEYEILEHPRHPHHHHDCGNNSMDSNVDSNNGEKKIGRFQTPKPLPPLRRWYSDELDDLIYEFNNMVEQLNVQYFDLEEQVRIRTQEAQLARELTEKANAAKTEFIAVISHELRTPLNGIMGLTSVSVEENDIHKIRTGLRLIIESGKTLMDLLNELLELSKSLVSVDPIVREFTPTSFFETLPGLFRSRTAKITSSFALAVNPSTLASCKLRGDLDHTLQICISVMSNAMKFSPRNGNVAVIMQLRTFGNDPKIKTDVYEKQDFSPNAVMEIIVADCGVGMSPSQLSKIFDLFVQGDDPMRRTYRGAGLGMALSKQLADGIGGYVSVYSCKSVGTCVIIRAPIEMISPPFTRNFLGPPLGFKVPDVYYTNSDTPGVVNLLMPVERSSKDFTNLSLTNLPLFPNRSGKHTHSASTGNRNQFSAKSSQVSRLLRNGSQSNNSNEYLHRVNSSASVRSHSTELESVKTGKFSLNSPVTWVYDIPESIFDRNHVETEREPSSPITTHSDGFEPTFTSNLLFFIKPDQSVPNTRNNSESSIIMKDPSEAHIRHASQERLLSMDDDNPEAFASTKILIAEDNKLNQKIMVQLLKKIGVLHTDTADNGQQAIECVEKSIINGFHYDLILMDMSMPIVDGLKATQIIRVNLGYSYPIVALTGYSDTETSNSCKRAGMEEVLVKPITLDELRRVIKVYKSRR